MQPLKAHIRNRRLVLDEPTDSPEGEVVEFVPLDEGLARGGDYLDDKERAELHRALEESIAQADARPLIDADDVLARASSRAVKVASRRGRGVRPWRWRGGVDSLALGRR